MWFRYRRNKQVEEPTNLLIAQECETYLAGTYLDTVFNRGDDVPSWAWLNKLARSDEATLAELAENPGSPDPRPELWAWRRTVSFLAAEVLDVVRTGPVPLDELQVAVLGPIEFAAMAEPMGPSTALRVVLSALHEHAGDRA